jgi:hypothetical protein
MIVAYSVVHYGSDYIGYAIKSVYDHVDKILIFYTNKPSHGHSSNLNNPDSRDRVKNAAYNTFGDPQNKIIWEEGNWEHEGKHRDHAVDTAAKHGADVVLVLDTDEIWPKDVLEKFLDQVTKSTRYQFGIRMLTFWRNFSTICIDDMLPIRAKKPKISNRDYEWIDGRVLHFGYARKSEDIAYKISCHGHSNEWDKNWYSKKFLGWPGCGNADLHPTCKNTWAAQPYDKTTLPEFMKSHPYYNLEII